MSDFEIGKLAQVVHVTDSLADTAALYTGLFGGERFFEGYSPHEKRDASIIAIGDLVVEPMTPAVEAGADEFPVGRFLTRFGSHLHSIALNVTGVPALYEHLLDHDIRVVGPGGSDPATPTGGGVHSIYTHPKDAHCLLEFVDFGAPVMPGSPLADESWASGWSTDHPLGVLGASHVTVVVSDLDRATAFFHGVLGCEVIAERSSGASGACRFVRLGTETVVELLQPGPDNERACRDLEDNGEIVHAITLRVVDVDEAARQCSAADMRIVQWSDDTVVLDPVACFGAVIALSDTD